MKKTEIYSFPGPIAGSRFAVLLFVTTGLLGIEAHGQIFKKKRVETTPEAKGEAIDKTKAAEPPKPQTKKTPPKPQTRKPLPRPNKKTGKTRVAPEKKAPPPKPSAPAVSKTEETPAAPEGEAPDKIEVENAAFKKEMERILQRIAVLENEGKLSPDQKARQAELKRKLVSLREKKVALDRAIEEGLDPAIVATSKREIDSDISKTEAALASIQPVSAGQNVRTIESLKTELKRLEEEIAEVKTQVAAQDEKIASYEPAKGFVFKGPGGSYLKLSGLLQIRMESAEDGAPSGESWSFGTYIRRMRLMFIGKLTDWLTFFIETDHSNIGLNGGWAGRMFIQDAYVEFNVHPAFQVDIGMLLPPFSRHGFQGATSLLAMDYHGKLIKYPTGSTFVWRDMGVKIRGLLFNDVFDYRLAIFSGVHGSATDPRNPDDAPRLSGRATFNVFDAEGGAGAGGMFYDGLYIAKSDVGLVSTKRILSFGASIDWQPDLNVEVEDPARREAVTDPYTATDRSDYVAAAGDVFWDIPIGGNKLMSVGGQLDFYYYYHGDRRSSEGYWYYNEIGDGLCYTGIGFFGEAGFRYSYFQPVFIIDLFESTKANGNAGDYLGVAGGMNYYLRGHGTTFKLQIGADQNNGGDWLTAVKLQVQLIF